LDRFDLIFIFLFQTSNPKIDQWNGFFSIYLFLFFIDCYFVVRNISRKVSREMFSKIDKPNERWLCFQNHLFLIDFGLDKMKPHQAQNHNNLQQPNLKIPTTTTKKQSTTHICQDLFPVVFDEEKRTPRRDMNGETLSKIIDILFKVSIFIPLSLTLTLIISFGHSMEGLQYIFLNSIKEENISVFEMFYFSFHFLFGNNSSYILSNVLLESIPSPS